MNSSNPESQNPPASTPPSAPAAGVQRFSTDDERKNKARRFFDHARKATESRSYDYAIKLYADGLALWPDAVDEGLKPLRVVATARRLEGGKPAGFLEARKRSPTGRDPLVNLSNALYLYGMDPGGVQHMEAILKNAAKVGLDRVVQWIAPVLVEGYDNAKKLGAAHYADACEAMDFTADMADQAGDDLIAIDIFQACIATAQIWGRHYPDSSDAQRARSSASGKLAIVKGKFARADGFTESLKDAGAQREVHDRDRAALSPERLNALIESARREWQANPDVTGKLMALADLLVRTNDPVREKEAIDLLEQQFAATQIYAYRARADDIRMRQLARRRRELESQVKADPNATEARRALEEHVARQVEREIAIFEDRVRIYPTEGRHRFELGSRLFQARRFDEAIPLFQQAQLDGRFRAESRLLIGRCFFEKGFIDQAISVLRKGVQELDSATGPLVLELNYWLGRSLEKGAKPDEARQVFGQLIQIDYNYRDARKRLEQLVDGG